MSDLTDTYTITRADGLRVLSIATNAITVYIPSAANNAIISVKAVAAILEKIADAMAAESHAIIFSRPEHDGILILIPAHGYLMFFVMAVL